MPAYKTFERFAEKIAKAMELIEQGKAKQAVTILKKLHESASKRSGTESGKPATKRALSPYAAFVKENYARIAAANPEVPRKEIMGLIAAEWKSGANETFKPKKTTTKAKKEPAKKAPAKAKKTPAKAKKTPAKKESTKAKKTPAKAKKETTKKSGKKSAAFSFY